MEMILPWNDSHFEGSITQKEKVYSNLRRMGFPVDNWRKSTPTPQVAGAIGKVLPGAIFEKKWQLVCSNSVTLLQALAESGPIVFSLSTHDSSLTLTTEKLVSRFRTFEEDVQADKDLVVMARTFGLVCWFNVMQAHETGDRYHSRFADLLIKRKALGYPTLFLATYLPGDGRKFDEKSADLIFKKIKTALGETAAVVIREASAILYLEVEIGFSEMESIKL